MNDYIDAVCEGSPLEPPTYNDEIEQWELYFEESATAWHPYDERDLISVSFEMYLDCSFFTIFIAFFNLGKHGERVSDDRKVPETHFKTTKVYRQHHSIHWYSKKWYSRGSPICRPVLIE